MNAKLVRQAYGKSEVRLARIVREDDLHRLFELKVSITLEGDFGAAYIAGDNSRVIPTDTMKNVVHVLAARSEFRSIELFFLSCWRSISWMNSRTLIAPTWASSSGGRTEFSPPMAATSGIHTCRHIHRQNTYVSTETITVQD